MTETVLIGDIGGTYVRLALITDGRNPGCSTASMSHAHASLAGAIEAGLADLESADRPARASLALAGPVTEAGFRLTNGPDWHIDANRLRRDLGLAALTLVNDFVAVALAVPDLSREDSRRLGGPDIGAAGGGPRSPIAVLGAGTGLGVSALVPCKEGWQVIAGEGGHAGLAATEEREAGVLATIRRGGLRTSAERLLSGPGLRAIYAALAGIPPHAAPQPDEIAAAASDTARKTLALFAGWLGSFAGDLALIFGARDGVYVGGGVVPRLGDAFPVDHFRARFEAKGRFASYVAPIPTRLIMRGDIGLLGAAKALGCSAPGFLTVTDVA